MMNHSNLILKDLIGQSEKDTTCLCSSFSDKVLKVACAMANGLGGNILVGVADDKSIAGIDASEIKDVITSLSYQIVPTLPFAFNVLEEDGKNVLLISVLMGGNKPYTALNHFYVQEGEVVKKANLTQVDALFEERARIETSWEREPNKQTDMESLSKSVLERFRERFVSTERCSSTSSNEEICKLLSFIIDDSITNAGSVILHEHPSEVLPQIRIRVSQFGDALGEELINVRLFDGNTVQVVDEITSYVLGFYPLKMDIVNNQRTQIETLPKIALREGVLNAIVHRSYESYNSFVAINLYADRIEITNSGNLPRGISVKDLSNPHRSILRNPDIANAFFILGYIEMAGSGTQRIINECKVNNCKMPQWENENDYVKLTFPEIHHGQSAIKTKNWDAVAEGLGLEPGVSKSLAIILNYLSMNDSVKLNELTEITKKSYPTVKRYTQILKEAGLIYYVGNARSGGWHLRLKQ